MGQRQSVYNAVGTTPEDALEHLVLLLQYQVDTQYRALTKIKWVKEGKKKEEKKKRYVLVARCPKRADCKIKITEHRPYVKQSDSGRPQGIQRKEQTSIYNASILF